MKETGFENEKNILSLKKKKTELERRSWLFTSLVLIFCFLAVIFYMEASYPNMLAEENFQRIESLTLVAKLFFASTVVLFFFLLFFKIRIWRLKEVVEKFEEIIDIISSKA